MSDIWTPFDEPHGLWQRIIFPSLRTAYLAGYRAARPEPPHLTAEQIAAYAMGKATRQRYPNE